MADRYTYLPSIGPFFVIGITMGWARERIVSTGAKKTARAALAITLCLVTITISSITIKQIRIWKDGVTLWGYELATLHKKNSQDFFVIWTAYAGKGLAHMRKGAYESAIDDFSKAILLKADAMNYQRRANAYAKLEMFAETIQDLTLAISMDPKSAVLYYNRGTAYARHGSFSEAIADLSKAIELSTEPKADYYMNRGNALKRLGRLDEGERDVMEANKIKNATRRGDGAPFPIGE
jgi:tetratricopeptide (TPR) repeat protein